MPGPLLKYPGTDNSGDQSQVCPLFTDNSVLGDLRRVPCPLTDNSVLGDLLRVRC